MNGYTRITIEGHEVGLKFGYECNKWFLTAYFDQIETYSDGKNLTLIGFAKLFHCAYRNNCAIKDEKPVLTNEDFYNGIEQMLRDEPEKFSEALDVWAKAESTKDVLDKLKALNNQVEDDEEKKTSVLTS
jgi:hypothetical protein